MAKTIVETEVTEQGTFRVTYEESSRVKVDPLAPKVREVINEAIRSMLGSQDVSNLDRAQIERWFVDSSSDYLTEVTLKFLRNEGVLSAEA